MEHISDVCFITYININRFQKKGEWEKGDGEMGRMGESERE